jgi:starch synthase
LFDRDGIVGFGDDDARSVFFSRALLEMLPALEFFPDVIHVHDWFAALVPNLLDRVYSEGAYAKIASNLTIHNLAAQGTFGFGALVLAGLEDWGLIQVAYPGSTAWSTSSAVASISRTSSTPSASDTHRRFRRSSTARGSTSCCAAMLTSSMEW